MLGVVVLTRDQQVEDAARAAARTIGCQIAIGASLGQVVEATQALQWSELVIDRAHPDGAIALDHLARIAGGRRVICVEREAVAPALADAQLVVLAPVLGRALVELSARRAAPVPSSFERLQAASVLGGSLDDAIDAAAHELAIAFGVARCIICDRTDPLGGVQSEGATFDADAWNTTIMRCRAAAEHGATLVVPAAHEPGACDSYTAVHLETPRGGSGFVGLIATGARAFTGDERTVLRAVAARLGRELRWRAMHDRTAEELERTLAGPGVDPLLGIWNRAGLDQLAHAYVSNAKRSKQPLTVLAVHVTDLDAVNQRHGMAMGDRLLRRAAEALKPALRGEDFVGRYSGTVLVVLLQGTGAEDARQVATRVQAMLAERSLEIADGALHIGTTIGIMPAHDKDDAITLLRRTVRATRQAPARSIAMLSAPTTFTGKIPHPTDSSDIPIRAAFGGAYRLRHEISRGGMGVVYRADDLALERPVAIKMLRPELAQNEELVKYLRREAALLARVRHPNLVQIYNFGRTDEDCYFVMELVEGESLQQAIERHRGEKVPMPISDLLEVVDHVASALDELHERGIVHRDVKPANFIRDPFTGRSVLVDVGIAHRFGELSKQAGTPGFMAPEVIQGIAASPRSDVYGLAASMYAMATLAPPWGDGEPIDIIMRQCNETPPRASELRPELAPIDEVLADALSFDVDRRPASAGELARALVRSLGTIMPARSSRTRTRSKLQLDAESAARTRGVVFQSALRALSARDADRLRDALGQDQPALAEALATCAPLGWAPSQLLVQLLAMAPRQLARDEATVAREIARETVRASFRSFFPASPATLHPDRTLSAIRGIWSRYHTWGNVSAVPVKSGETIVRIGRTLRVRALCEWTRGLLESLVSMSGGRDVASAHDECELDGAQACAFRVTWTE